MPDGNVTFNSFVADESALQMRKGVNGTPTGVPLDVSRATLPINQLKSADIKDVRSNSNVHRCKKIYYIAVVTYSFENIHGYIF